MKELANKQYRTLTNVEITMLDVAEYIGKQDNSTQFEALGMYQALILSSRIGEA